MSKENSSGGGGIGSGGQLNPVFRVPGLPDRGDPDPREVHDRALELADAAADAELLDHDRDLHRLSPLPRALLEDDRLLRGGAVLLADDAGGPLGEGDAAGGVDEGQADDDLLLIRDGEFPDRLGGTDLPAEGGVVLAVADEGDAQASADPLDPPRQPGWL